MQLGLLASLFCLVLAHNLVGMQNSSALEFNQEKRPMHLVPGKVSPKIFLTGSSWEFVHTLLALQQTCHPFFHMLNNKAKKDIIASIFFNGTDFDENAYAKFTLTRISRRKRLQDESKSALEAMKKTSPELYLFAGADVNYVADGGPNSMLMDTILKLTPDTFESTATYVNALIKQGADVNYKNLYGNTSLHIAVSNNAVRLVELLLVAKAEITAQNALSKTPAQWVNKRSPYIKHNPEHAQRIQQLLDGSITPEESSNRPLPAFVDPKKRNF